jgi:hypothetical protein
MMAAKHKSRRVTGKLPEDIKISKPSGQTNEEGLVRIGPPVGQGKQRNSEQRSFRELPYVDVPPLPYVRREPKKAIIEELEEETVVVEPGFRNQAPLQSDEKAKDIVKNALRNPISITTEDLLNVSEPMRQELRKLLTKKRIEKKSVAFVAEAKEDDELLSVENLESLSTEKEDVINVEKLPEATYEVLLQERDGLPKGALIIGDPVVQYLSTLKPGEKPKPIIVASESQGLRAVYPLINGVGEVESLLDGGSQIVSMSRAVAVELEVTWDPDITVQMQSANRSLEETLGLAKNVPFLFGQITVYLQIHVMDKPAYKVLLGRPFDTITESIVKNERDGSQSLTLTDPNTGERCVMHTHERGKPPTVLKRPVRQGFQNSMI